MIPHTKQRKSAVLILALLLMGAIIGSGISLSTVIADSSRQSQTLNDFIAASLVADSGVERGLAAVKTGRVGSDLATTLTRIATTTAISQATVTSTSPSTSTLGWNVVRPNETVSFDIGKTDVSNIDQYTLNITAQPAYTSYTSTNGPVQFAVGDPKLDVSWLGLDDKGQPFYSGKKILSLNNDPDPSISEPLNLLNAGYLYNLDGQRLGSSTTSSIQLTKTQGFRIRIKPIAQTVSFSATPIPADLARVTLDHDSVKQLRVTGSANFPSRIEITSQGKVNQSQSEKKASVLWQLPSSAAFGYVLFTEGDIIPQ